MVWVIASSSDSVDGLDAYGGKVVVVVAKYYVGLFGKQQSDRCSCSMMLVQLWVEEQGQRKRRLGIKLFRAALNGFSDCVAKLVPASSGYCRWKLCTSHLWASPFIRRVLVDVD